MISEDELRLAVFNVVQRTRSQLFPLARRVFQDERVQAAMQQGNPEALVDALIRSLDMWIPDPSKLLAVVNILGEVALDEFQLLKTKFQLSEGVENENF